MKKESENTPTKVIPVSKAFLLIFLSACLIFSLFLLVTLFYKHIKAKKHADPSYNIVAVVESSNNLSGFKTAFFAEVLNLSIDHPQNLYAFNFKEAENKLLKLSALKSVKVRKIFPGTLHIEYTTKKPIAYYGDYTNTAVDTDGYIFPFKPFFTLKKLPKIITGIDLLSDAASKEHEDCASEEVYSKECVWGRKVENNLLDLSFKILALAPSFCDNKTELKCIDVSRAFAKTIGEREVVLTLEDRIVRIKDGRSKVCIYPRLLRLSPDSFKEQLANYIPLRKYFREDENSLQIASDKEGAVELPTIVIDLRITDLAFFHILNRNNF